MCVCVSVRALQAYEFIALENSFFRCPLSFASLMFIALGSAFENGNAFDYIGMCVLCAVELAQNCAAKRRAALPKICAQTESTKHIMHHIEAAAISTAMERRMM